MRNTLQIVKGLVSDPVPYINTTVLFGLSAMQWDLAIKLLVAIPSVVWTYFRLLNEIRKFRAGKIEDKNEA